SSDRSPSKLPEMQECGSLNREESVVGRAYTISAGCAIPGEGGPGSGCFERSSRLKPVYDEEPASVAWRGSIWTTVDTVTYPISKTNLATVEQSGGKLAPTGAASAPAGGAFPPKGQPQPKEGRPLPQQGRGFPREGRALPSAGRA